MLSPEALLRGSVSYYLPSNYHGRVRTPASPSKQLGIRAVCAWNQPLSLLESFLECLRAARFRLAPLELNCIESCERDHTLPLTRAILYLVNRGGFLSDDIPGLEAAVNESTLDNCIAVSFELGGPVSGENPVDWYFPGASPDRWTDCRKCLCAAFMISPGTIDPSQWSYPVSLSRPQPSMFIPEITKVCEHLATAYAALTDGSTTVLLCIQEWCEEYIVSVTCITDEPPQLCLALLVYTEATRSHLWGMHSIPLPSPYLGALNDTSIPLPPIDSIIASRRIFSDFDVYTMQRDKRQWEQFLVWKAAKLREAEIRPLRVGDTLTAETQSFVRHFSLLRSPLRVPPIPSETVGRIARQPRSRDQAVETITSIPGDSFTFTITGVIRAAKDTFSQVFSGVAQRKDGISSQKVCLKLYDERLFGTPSYGDVDDGDDTGFDDEVARWRLLNWNNAEDIARREEASYDRLKAFQGSLIPHSYGFHHFTLPDGHRCIGFLMEYIDGVSLANSQISNMPQDVQKGFALNVRHGLRVLRYAQIEQTDWHVNQFIVKPFATEGVPPEFVFIDFGFAVQHLDALYTPPTRDWYYCRNRLWEVMDNDIVKSVWFPLDENEY